MFFIVQANTNELFMFSLLKDSPVCSIVCPMVHSEMHKEPDNLWHEKHQFKPHQKYLLP